MKAIFKIMPAAGSNFNAVNYNEKKVKEGKGGLVYFENFSYLQEKAAINKEEFKDYLKKYSGRNKKIQNPSFHATCSCRGTELTHEQLKDISLEVMKGLGYEHNPILIYAHNDTKNNHVHIVTSRVGENGKKINDSFEGKKANQILNSILNRQPKQEFDWILSSALSYKFGTISQFNLLIELNGYSIKKKDDDFVYYKHGEKLGSINIADIERRVETCVNKNDHSEQMRAIFRKYKPMYSGALRSNHDKRFTKEKKQFHNDFTDFLKQKFGIDIVFFAADSQSTPYGYAIVDHHNKEVHKGSDIMKLSILLDDLPGPSREQYRIGISEKEANSFVDSGKVPYFSPDSYFKPNLSLALEEFIEELERESHLDAGKKKIKKRRSF